MKDIPDFEPFETSISVIGEKHTTWSQVSTLLEEEGKRIKSKHETNSSYTMNDSGRLAQASHKINSDDSEKKNNLPRQIICYYFNKKGHMKKIAMPVSVVNINH